MTRAPEHAATRIRELTPRGRGGVTVLELTGPDALRCLATIAPGLERRSPASLGKSVLVRLAVETDEGAEELDEALVWERESDCLELHIHGSPVLAMRVRGLLQVAGAAPVGGGSASSHGSSDAQLGPCRFRERAELALASAPSEAAARMLLDQAGGALEAALCKLPELDLVSRRAALDALVAAGAVGARLVTPPRVVLAGPVNAGKSTLFNLLVGAERVVVSSEEGTTRDAVEARVLIGAYAVDLVDTAGAREATGQAAAVEQSGQAQGLAAAAMADLVLLLVPATGGIEAGREAREVLGQASQTQVVELATKVDQAPGQVPGLSCRADPHGAVELVQEALLRALQLPRSPWRPGAAAPFDKPAMDRIASLQLAVDSPNFGQLSETPL